MKVDYFSVPDARALVVDDFPINLEVAKGMLAPYQIKVYCALSGQQAVRLVREGKTRYDIIFMDHMMPELDGMETVKAIRGLDGDYAKNVPIVALTACADESQAGLFLSNGFQGFLTKPINPVKMNAVLREHLGQRADIKEAPAGEEPPAELKPVSALNDALLLLFAGTHIEGINLTDVVSRYNDADTYARVLDSFKRNVSKQVLELLRSRTDLAACSVLAHGIKGGCFGVGAEDAGKAADAIENAAKEGDADTVSRAMLPFANQIEQLLADLGGLLDNVRHLREQHSAGTKPEPDRALLSEMLEGSVGFDATKMRIVMEKLSAFEYESGGELIDWLRQKVSDFNYEAIRERLSDYLAG